MSFLDIIKSESGKISLIKLDPPAPELLISDQECINIAFLDTETTGINKYKDEIIELAIKLVKFEKPSYKIVSIKQSYESFNESSDKLSKKIMLLTGITNEMIAGKSINWNLVDKILTNADLIISHNASFDRAFLDRYSTISPKSLWGCSINDVDWLGKGFSSPKQELLCYWHGFYFEAHRAMSDVDALINLLTHHHYGNARPINEIVENVKEPKIKIYVNNFNYDLQKIEKLKANQYRWDNNNKKWFKITHKKNLKNEEEWLMSCVYNSHFEGTIELIDSVDIYKL